MEMEKEADRDEEKTKEPRTVLELLKMEGHKSIRLGVKPSLLLLSPSIYTFNPSALTALEHRVISFIISPLLPNRMELILLSAAFSIRFLLWLYYIPLHIRFIRNGEQYIGSPLSIWMGAYSLQFLLFAVFLLLRRFRTLAKVLKDTSIALEIMLWIVGMALLLGYEAAMSDSLLVILNCSEFIRNDTIAIGTSILVCSFVLICREHRPMIESLPTFIFFAEGGNDRPTPTQRFITPQEADFCSICRNDYENAEIVMELPCIHNFHASCINQWLNMRATCPYCKSTLS